MSELSAERRAALEQALLSSTRDTCDDVECDPSGNAVIHLEAIAPLIAGWLAEERAAALDAAASEASERGDIGKDGGPEAWDWLRARVSGNGKCPSCGETKFIGHGPLCLDCFKDRRPCGGRNSNVCVAEGCYGEACIKGGGE